MNDEQFEKAINKIWLFSPSMADQLRARNTAQREALARVEAERDRLAKRLCICQECGGRGEVHTGEYTNEGHWQPPEPVMVECGECGGDGQIGQVTDLDTAQAQLAEAVILIGQVQDCRSFDDVKVISRWLSEFLARHAQAEQQEAQDAQAGDELDAIAEAIFNADKDNWYSAGPYPQLHANDKARLRAMARAALATQPSAGEPVDGVEGFACWLIDHCEGYEIFEEKIQEWVAGYLKSEAYQRVAAPPAAAHGDEAVLWELLEELRTATDRQALPGEFIRVMWEAGCDWINARAAMRAQGDGESV